MKRKEIVLVKETRQKEFVKKVMDAISPHLNVKASDKVAIKINLSGSREIYANTHYETVESVIFYLKDHFGVTDISVIEGSDGAYFTGKTTWDIFYKFRYKEVELNGAKLVNLDELPHDNVLDVQTLNGPRKVHYTKFDADYLISIVPPKTHNILPLCLSIPNMIGFVKPEERSFLFGASATELKKINSYKNDRLFQLWNYAGKNLTALLKEINPSLAIIDGLYGMEGKGPIKGSPVFHGFAIASEDIVLVDSLTTYIMGFEVDQIPYISFAYQQGLGNNRWQNIIGVEPTQVKFPYRPHPFFQKQKLWKNQNQKSFRSGNRDNRDRNSQDYRNKDNKDRNYKDRNERDNRDRTPYKKDEKDKNLQDKDNRDRNYSRDNNRDRNYRDHDNRDRNFHDRNQNNRFNNPDRKEENKEKTNNEPENK
jgi:uncharacterized protein (DUF362 family)